MKTSFLKCTFVLLFFSGCIKKEIKIRVNEKIRLYGIDNIVESGPVNLSKIITNRRYLFLNSLGIHIQRIDKILVNQNSIFVYNKKLKTLFVFNSNGNLSFKLQNIITFDVFKTDIYTYNYLTGKMVVFDKKGQITRVFSLGFRGIEFAVLSKSSFVFYTAGLVTDDFGSKHYQIALIDSSGILTGFGLPMTSIKKSINYSASNRFLRVEDEVHFIPSLSSTEYVIKESEIQEVARFDFENFNLTDEIFEKFSRIENYGVFPYVLDVTLTAAAGDLSFYNFTLKGEEGYFVINRKENKVLYRGISSVSDISTDYSSTVPSSWYNEELISVIPYLEYKNNLDLRLNISDAHIESPPRVKKNENRNPVLIYYRIE